LQQQAADADDDADGDFLAVVSGCQIDELMKLTVMKKTYIASSSIAVDSQLQYTDKKLSYRRETARQLRTWRGLSPPVHFPSPSGYTSAYGRIRNPQQTYAKRAVRKAQFKLNRAFKVIQGYPYLCRQEPRAVYCRNVQLMSRLFLKLTKMWQQEHSKFVDFNDPTQV